MQNLPTTDRTGIRREEEVLGRLLNEANFPSSLTIEALLRRRSLSWLIGLVDGDILDQTTSGEINYKMYLTIKQHEIYAHRFQFSEGGLS